MFSLNRLRKEARRTRTPMSTPRRHAQFFRPYLEQLEDRRLLSDYPLTAYGMNITPIEGASFSGAVASFTDADPGPNISDFSATIDWGDGATSTGTISADGSGGFNVNGSHAYGSEGAYTTSVTINDVAPLPAWRPSPMRL